MVLSGLGLVPALVLVWSGWSKVREPSPVSAALRALRLPHGRVAGRALGAAEILLGATVVVATPLTWAALAAWYAGLLIAAVALRRTSVASCGCFGADSPPPGAAHVVTNVAAAAAATAAGWSARPDWPAWSTRRASGRPSCSAPTRFLASWLVVVVLTDLMAVGRTEPEAVPVFEVTAW